MFRAITAIAATMLMTAAPLAAKSKDPVKVTSPSAIKGTQKVVIGQFTLGFLMERKDSAKAGGGLVGGFGGRSTTKSNLVGIGPAEMQQIADAAYADFVSKLIARGFEVIDRAGYAADPGVAKTKVTASPYEASTITGKDDKAKAQFVSAAQTAPLKMLAGDVTAGGFGAMGMAMSGSQIAMAQSAYAKANDTRVVNAIYYVDFADSKEYGGFFASGSSVKVKGSLAMLPAQTKISVVGPNYKTGVLALADPVAVGGDFFTAEDTETGGQKAEQAVANVIGFLGGVGTNSSKRYTFTATTATFVPGAIQAAADANATLIAKLATLR